MAERTEPTFGRVGKTESQTLPYRPVLNWPTSIFIDEVLAHLKATAQPETCDLLYRNKLAKTTKFRIVRKIDLDQRKRPEGDLAPCPMCTANRFLGGALVFLPELLCCAVIGHCCAAKEARDEAEREYKRRSQRDYEESLLLANLPIITKKADVLAKLRPAAEEARRIYRRFRNEAPSVHDHLRELKVRRGGHLTVAELVERNEQQEDVQDYGPRGLDRRTDEQTREIDFGAFNGQTAVIKDYNPVKELDHIVRILMSLDTTPTEEQALEFIVAMTDAQRRAAVAIIEGIDTAYGKFVAKIRDFANFFALANIEMIHAYGDHPSNPFRIQAKYGLIRGRPRITIQHKGEHCQLLISAQMNDVDYDWPREAS